MSQLIVKDAHKNNQTLYLGSESVLTSALSSYEMPPSMAELTGFDARYSSGRMVETYPAVMSNTAKYEYSISIQSNAYPVMITPGRDEKRHWQGLNITARSTARENCWGKLSGSGSSIKITNASVKASRVDDERQM